MSVTTEDLKRFNPAWVEVGRIFRRICFLRAEGHSAEAQRIEETEFTEATARASAGSGSEFEAESTLQSLLVEEKERVRNAVAFAEILVPMLAERLGANLSPTRAAAHVVKKVKAQVPTPGRDIADFIDDMIRQDKSA